MTTEIMQCLPKRDWLALGQAIHDRDPRSNLIDSPNGFEAHSTWRIQIGRNCSIKAGGRTFGEGIYVLDADQT